jgi:hypothetical protein
MGEPIIENRTEQTGEWVTRQVEHTYEDLLELFPEDDNLVNPLVRRCQDLEWLLGRIKNHWEEGVSEDTENQSSWHGTMRDMLDEFEADD